MFKFDTNALNSLGVTNVESSLKKIKIQFGAKGNITTTTTTTI